MLGTQKTYSINEIAKFLTPKLNIFLLGQERDLDQQLRITMQKIYWDINLKLILRTILKNLSVRTNVFYTCSYI